MDNVIHYNKAIRDKIPDIIRESGRKCEVIRLSDEEFLVELEKKLSEELDEYRESGSIEELCDIVEISLRIAELKGVHSLEFNQLREEKNIERGAFKSNLFLKFVDNLDQILNI